MNWTMIEFIDSLQRLSLPPDKQIASLPDDCCKADELALDFDNSRHAEGVELPSNAVPLVEGLYRLLLMMSREPDGKLWTEDALRTRMEWDVVRQKSKQILATIGMSPTNEL